MGIEPERWAQHSLHKLMELLNDIKDALASNRWRLTNAKAVLVQGPAGIGKSHLLADIVEHQVHESRPALLLGSWLNDDEPWRQILAWLDRPSTEQIKHFLGALDAAAQAAGTRAIVCIDALNKRNGIDIWPHGLAAFLKTVEPFGRVGVPFNPQLRALGPRERRTWLDSDSEIINEASLIDLAQVASPLGILKLDWVWVMGGRRRSATHGFASTASSFTVKFRLRLSIVSVGKF